jgi:SSS family solute:Na+ symporter
VNLALVLYSGGLALNYIFGIDMTVSVVLLAALTGAYTVYGGLSSVVWTDVFQCVVLLIGGLLIFVLGVLNVDGGWTAILGTGDRAHLILPADHPELPWTAMVAVALVSGTWYYCTNQYINQRCLGARDEWHAKMGMVFCAFLGLLLALAVTFPGLIAYAINPDLDDPNTAFPYLVTTLVPPALRGILLAALISAIMSTISSLVNSTSTVFTIDIYERFVRRDASQQRLIAVGRYAGIGVMLVGLACVPLVSLWEHIFAYCQEIWILLAGPTVAVFLIGVLWRRATAVAATLTMALSFPLAAVPFVEKMFPFLPGPLANIYVLGGVVFIACVLFMVLLSLATVQPGREKADMPHWSPDMLKLPETLAPAQFPWYKRVGVWWLLVGAAYCAIYAIFW